MKKRRTKAQEANAERQRRYRERATKDIDGPLLTRLQVLLDPNAAANLERLKKATGRPKRALIERAINELAKALQCNTDDE